MIKSRSNAFHACNVMNAMGSHTIVTVREAVWFHLPLNQKKHQVETTTQFPMLRLLLVVQLLVQPVALVPFLDPSPFLVPCPSVVHMHRKRSWSSATAAGTTGCSGSGGSASSDWSAPPNTRLTKDNSISLPIPKSYRRKSWSPCNKSLQLKQDAIILVDELRNW